MKKILICAYNLDMGGIETSLVNLLKELSKEKCDISLLLQKKEGNLLKHIPKNIHIEEYKLSTNKNILFRKIKNRFKLISFILKNQNKYNISICYATYDYPSSIITRKVSENSIIWIHSDYYYVFHSDLKKYMNFFNKRKINNFKKIVFVSNESKNTFIKNYPELKNKTSVVNNIIDFQSILKKANKIKIKESKKPLVLFVGRLEEESKGLFLLLDIAREMTDFNFWFVGDGKDKLKYIEYIKTQKIKNVKLLGNKNNPYPYMKKADIIMLPSIYEGFPVVTLEGLVLHKKVITTVNVSANDFKLSDFAYLVKRDKEAIKRSIKEVFYKNTPSFDFKRYNKKNIDFSKKIIIGDKNEI